MDKVSEELIKHFVVSGYIVFSNQLLLVAHRKLGKWLPPGGHIEERETPEDALKREISEEVGIPVTILAASDHQGDDKGVQSLLLPRHIQLEDIDELHQHIDLVYFCQAFDNHIRVEEAKLAGARWFSSEELNSHADIQFEGVTLPKHVSHFGLQALKSLQVDSLTST